MSTTTRILTQHDPQADYHAWLMLGRVQWLDTIGRRNQGRYGSHQWHVVECNNSACPAMAIIREDAIIALLLAEPVPASFIDRLADAIVTTAGGPMTPVDRPTTAAADQGVETHDGPTVDHSTPGEPPPFPTFMAGVPDQPDGIADDSRDVPDPLRAAARVRAYVTETGDGLYDVEGRMPLYGRDLESLCRAAVGYADLLAEVVQMRQEQIRRDDARRVATAASTGSVHTVVKLAALGLTAMDTLIAPIVINPQEQA